MLEQEHFVGANDPAYRGDRRQSGQLQRTLRM